MLPLVEYQIGSKHYIIARAMNLFFVSLLLGSRCGALAMVGICKGAEQAKQPQAFPALRGSSQGSRIAPGPRNISGSLCGCGRRLNRPCSDPGASRAFEASHLAVSLFAALA